MMMNDPIGDMLTRLRNAQSARKKEVMVPFSKFRIAVLDVLKNEGYIADYSTKVLRENLKNIYVTLKYVDLVPVISKIKRVSTPGRRVYSPISSLGTVHSGLGMKILSTSKGVLSDVQAKTSGIGGEIICEVF